MPKLDALRDKKQQLLAILGMATVLPSIHNQMLYPITFTYNKEGMTSVFIHYFLYAVIMLATVVVFALLKDQALRRFFTNWRALVCFGVIGCTGITLIVGCDFSSIISSIFVSIGIALAAVFVPIYFMFWSMQILTASHKRAAFDFLISFLIFCVFTGVRIALDIHGWPFAIIFPLLSAWLAYEALKLPQKSYPPTGGKFISFPYGQIIPAVVFIYIAAVCKWIVNPDSALFEYPPMDRAIMYAILVVSALILLAIFRPHSKYRPDAPFISIVLGIVFMVINLLVMAAMNQWGDELGFNWGNYPLVEGTILLETVIWLVILAYAQARHLGIVLISVLYLVLVVGAANVISVALMFSSQQFFIDRTTLPTLFISIVAAFIMLIVVIVIMIIMLTRKTEATHEHAPDEPPCVSSINEALDEDALIATLSKTFQLSKRESDTLRLLLKKMPAKAIAEQLYVAESTTQSHIKNIYRKMDVHSRKELLKLADHYKSEKRRDER